MVGDESCKAIIEAPWVNEPRVIRRSGVWDIRQTMTMAKECDIVIGPETGVLSAVAMEPMKKSCSCRTRPIENLTRDWVNTTSLHSRKRRLLPMPQADLPVGPMCNQDGKTGIAKCQADIQPSEVWDAICETFAEREAA
jgi:hypothetical protein